MKLKLFVPKPDAGIIPNRMSSVGGIRAGGNIIARNIVTGVQINGQSGFQVEVDAVRFVDFLLNELPSTERVMLWGEKAREAATVENEKDFLSYIERAIQSASNG